MTSGGINEETGKWLELRYFPYEIIHKKWQYHLFKMLKEVVPSNEMKSAVDELYRRYPKGLVAHVTRGKEVVTVNVLTFIGRMVQHIMPKGFQRIRY